MVLSLSVNAPSRAAEAWGWDWRWFMAAAATTTSQLFDDPLHDGFRRWEHTSELNFVMHGAEHYGGWVAPALGLVSFPVLWAVGTSSETPAFQRTKKIFASVGSYVVLSSALKFVAGRHRPYQGPDSTSVTPFSVHYSSFPSGHTGTAFAFSASLAFEFHSYWVKVPLYTMATLTGISRMYDNKHWFSDTVAGAFLGYFSALYSEEYFGKPASDESAHDQARWNFAPFFAQDGISGALFAQFY
jgi:membrane-associated phospholipid phosphatase